MLATCRGAKRGVSSMTTRPPGNSTYSVLSGSSGRQSAGREAARTSAMVGCGAAAASCDKKISAHGTKNLKLRPMHRVLHKSGTRLSEGRMRQIVMLGLVSLVWLGGGVQMALGQGYPGGGGMPGGAGGRPASNSIDPGGDRPPTPVEVKPDIASKKAYAAGVKSL